MPQQFLETATPTNVVGLFYSPAKGDLLPRPTWELQFSRIGVRSAAADGVAGGRAVAGGSFLQVGDNLAPRWL